MDKTLRVLIVLTSHSDLGNTGEKTGFWIEEFAAPYYVLADEQSIALIENFYKHNKQAAFVCHAPAALTKGSEPCLFRSRC